MAALGNEYSYPPLIEIGLRVQAERNLTLPGGSFQGADMKSSLKDELECGAQRGRQGYPLQQRIWKCGPCTSRNSLTWELVRNANSHRPSHRY